MGDSFVEARHVALEDTFCAILEHKLNTALIFDGKPVEVLNFAVSGYGTTQELLTLQHHVYGFEPDHIILTFSTGNDITDNSKLLSHTLRARPYFTIYENRIVLDTSFLQSDTFKARESLTATAFYATSEYSRLVQLIYRVQRGAPPHHLTQVSPFSEPGLADDIYHEPLDTNWEQAWSITERLIQEMHNEVSQQGIQFGIVTLSNPIQVHPDASVRQRFMKRLNVGNLFYPDRRLKALGDKAGIPVLNLAPRFQVYAEQHQVFLHGFKNTQLGVGHWNENAHRLAAGMIAEWLSGATTVQVVDMESQGSTSRPRSE